MHLEQTGSKQSKTTSTPEWLPSIFEKEVDEEAAKKITGGEKVDDYVLSTTTQMV